MSSRQYSVVVKPQQWSGTATELARLLAPVTGVSAPQLTPLLERGPMTVEADLTHDAARRLAERMSAKGLPVSIEGSGPTSSNDDPPEFVDIEDDVDLDDLFGDEPQTSAASDDSEPRPPSLRGADASGEDIFDDGAPSMPGAAPADQTDEGIPLSGRKTPEKKEEEGPKPEATLLGFARDDTESPDESERAPKATLLGFKRSDLDLGDDEPPQGISQKPGRPTRATPAGRPAEPDEDAPETESTAPMGAGGWGALFPDLDDDEKPARAAGSPPEEGELPTAAEDAPTNELPTAAEDAPTNELPTTPSLDELEQGDAAAKGGRGGKIPPTTKQPASPGPRDSDAAATAEMASRDEEQFDPSKLRPALSIGPDAERPPYAPEGFDDRPEHIPVIATILSVIAPGAGQIYNGRDDRALDYGFNFWKIVPWIESVKKAKERAEKIKTYWAPWPEEYSFFRALRYTIFWWVAVGGAAALMIWFGGRMWEIATRPDEPDVTAADIRRAYDDADLVVKEARIAALDALSEAVHRRPSKQFTMSDEERAARLFRMGHGYCEARDYANCELFMRKVTSIQAGHRGALRLQAWASVQRRDPGSAKMPDVGPVETLGEFEARQLSEEMGVPYRERPSDDTPETEKIAPDGDAGRTGASDGGIRRPQPIPEGGSP